MCDIFILPELFGSFWWINSSHCGNRRDDDCFPCRTNKFHLNNEKVIYLNAPSTHCNDPPCWVKELISNLGILIALFRATKMQRDILITGLQRKAVRNLHCWQTIVFMRNIYTVCQHSDFFIVWLCLIWYVKSIRANPYLSWWRSQDSKQREWCQSVLDRWMGILLLSVCEAGWISDS